MVITDSVSSHALRFCAEMAKAGLGMQDAQRALGVSEATVRGWCAGAYQAPQMAFLALELLAERRGSDGVVIAMACREAHLVAVSRIDAEMDADSLRLLLEIAHRYTAIAVRFERRAPERHPTMAER
jgi:hypothetical protein